MALATPTTRRVGAAALLAAAPNGLGAPPFIVPQKDFSIVLVSFFQSAGAPYLDDVDTSIIPLCRLPRLACHLEVASSALGLIKPGIRTPADT